MTTPDPRVVLALPMGENDALASTVGEYLVGLLFALWDEKEGFDSKRPFGNSSWDCDLIVPLINAGFVDGTIDEDGYLEGCDDDAADRLIGAAIRALLPEVNAS